METGVAVARDNAGFALTTKSGKKKTVKVKKAIINHKTKLLYAGCLGCSAQNTSRIQIPRHLICLFYGFLFPTGERALVSPGAVPNRHHGRHVQSHGKFMCSLHTTYVMFKVTARAWRSGQAFLAMFPFCPCFLSAHASFVYFGFQVCTVDASKASDRMNPACYKVTSFQTNVRDIFKSTKFARPWRLWLPLYIRPLAFVATTVHQTLGVCGYHCTSGPWRLWLPLYIRPLAFVATTVHQAVGVCGCKAQMVKWCKWCKWCTCCFGMAMVCAGHLRAHGVVQHHRQRYRQGPTRLQELQQQCHPLFLYSSRCARGRAGLLGGRGHHVVLRQHQ